MRRVLAVVASIGLGIGTIALATPAHAATNPSTVYVYCSNDAVKFYSDSGLTTEITQVTGPVGEQFTVSFSTPDGVGECNSNTYAYSYDNTGSTANAGTTTNLAIQAIPQNSPFWIDGNRANTEGVLVVQEGSGGGGGGSDSSSSSSPGSAPASEIQQFGLPASGNCKDGVTEAMNWSGIGIDGWGISWAQWMNEGAGAAVCTRTVVYDTSTAKWTVN